MKHTLEISLPSDVAERLDTLSQSEGRSAAELASAIIREKLVPRQPGLGSRIAAIWADADTSDFSPDRDGTAYSPPDV